MSWIKQKKIRRATVFVTANIIAVIFLLFSIETSAYLGRLLIGKESVGWLISGRNEKNFVLNDNCQRMLTHPFYSHTHDHGDNCEVVGGIPKGPFVFYDAPNELKQPIVVLGGSTTDGFYNHIHGGETWPLALSKIIKANKLDFSVINGGVGGYGSSQELLKLLLEIPKLSKPPKYVISLNGINDIPNYRGIKKSGFDEDLENAFPFWTWVHFNLMAKERYVKQDEVLDVNYFPAALSGMKALISKFVSDDNSRSNPDKTDWEKAINFTGQVKSSVWQQWYYNVRMMHAISKEQGAQYYVFLQPTMGLKANQIPVDEQSSDYELYLEMPQDYLEMINEHFNQLRKFCNLLDYCIDITSAVPPLGNMYSDPRHHNELGNAKLAQIIYNKIFLTE